MGPLVKLERPIGQRVGLGRSGRYCGGVFGVGDTVGDYLIVAKLKAGGMATLFLGKRTGASGFSRHLAIKVVHEHLASDETFVQMFVDEALLSSKIQHPNVVHVEELRQVDGRHLLVMEYVHGCSLAMLVNALRRSKRAFNADLATYVAVKVAGGLHAAHEATDALGQPLGVVHRDVSPQNVLLSYKGHVKLIDFGVAKAAGRATQTTGGSLKGKIRYMSPEQAYGRPVDRRTDVYALGIVLWEMLTGLPAFSGDNEFALLEQVRHPEVPPARTFNADVPEALDAVIQRALSVDMASRFQSCQEMRKALARACPTALALDEHDLAKLLATVLGENIRQDIAALPESVSGVVAPSFPQDDDALYTLTVSAAGLTSDPGGTDILVPVPHVSVAHTVALPEGFTPADGTSPPPAPPPELSSPFLEVEPRRSRAPLYAVASVVVVSIMAGIGALTFWQLSSDASGSIDATQLPITTSSQPTEVVVLEDAGVAAPLVDAGAPELAAPDPAVEVPDERDVEPPVEPPEPVAVRPAVRRGARRGGGRRGSGRGQRDTGGDDRGGSATGVFLTDDF